MYAASSEVALVRVPWVPPPPDYYYPTTPWTPDVIYLPGPQIAGLLMPPSGAAPGIAAVEMAATPLPRTIEHAHEGWLKLPPQAFIQARLAFERVMDHGLDYMLGNESNVQWAAAISDLHRAIQVAARGSNPQRTPSRQRSTTNLMYNTPERKTDREHQKHLEEGRRLSKVLARLLNLEVELTEGLYVAGEYRFVLHPWYGGDGVNVGRRLPNGKYQESKRAVFSKEQLAEALAELGAVGRPGGNVATSEEVRRGKVIVDRGPVKEIVLAKRTGGAEAEIASANESRRDAARAKLTDLASKMQQPARRPDGTPAHSRVDQRH